MYPFPHLRQKNWNWYPRCVERSVKLLVNGMLAMVGAPLVYKLPLRDTAVKDAPAGSRSPPAPTSPSAVASTGAPTAHR
jgi:hypothetical protein